MNRLINFIKFTINQIKKKKKIRETVTHKKRIVLLNEDNCIQLIQLNFLQNIQNFWEWRSMSRLIEAERVKKKRLQKDEESLRKIVKVLHKKTEEFYNCRCPRRLYSCHCFDEHSNSKNFHGSLTITKTSHFV